MAFIKANLLGGNFDFLSEVSVNGALRFEFLNLSWFHTCGQASNVLRVVESERISLEHLKRREFLAGIDNLS